MVDYIGVQQIQAMLRRSGPAAFIKGLAAQIAADYLRWPAFDKSARHAIYSPGGVIELMPASDGRLYSFKYVNGHPGNTARGLLTVTAFGVLADVETGYPLLVSELTLTTALRTAAMSALAAQKLARPQSRVMALIGNGAQSEFQALGFIHLLGIAELRLYDIDAAASAKLARNLAQLDLPNLQVHICSTTLEAVAGADIITTVTADKRQAVVLTPEMIAPGMHINAVGGDCPGKTELHPDILRRPDARVFVEYEPQSRIEGEIQQMPADFAVTEFANLISGAAPGRTDDEQVTIFDSVGFALTDYSALCYLYRLQQASAKKIKIDLIPELSDPKDLFSLIGGPSKARATASVEPPISPAIATESAK